MFGSSSCRGDFPIARNQRRIKKRGNMKILMNKITLRAIIKTRILLKDTDGDAVVEASILFPIMIMIFAALVILAAYLPTRSALQRSTQYAATALATEFSDTWIFYDIGNMDYRWERDKDSLGSVYTTIIPSGDCAQRAEEIVTGADMRLVTLREGDLVVEASVNRMLIYNEFKVTARREFEVPINLSIIGFPETIEIVVSSTAAAQDGDEFIRTVDMATDFAAFISERFNLPNVGEAIGSFGRRFRDIVGW